VNRLAWRLLYLASFALLVPAALLVAPYLLVVRLHALGLRVSRPWRWCRLKTRGWRKVGPLRASDGLGVYVKVRGRVRR
jgi:hypothetical protein